MQAVSNGVNKRSKGVYTDDVININQYVNSMRGTMIDKERGSTFMGENPCFKRVVQSVSNLRCRAYLRPWLC